MSCRDAACHACLFYFCTHENGRLAKSECHANPPVPVYDQKSGRIVGAFAPVSPDSWCREHYPKWLKEKADE